MDPLGKVAQEISGDGEAEVVNEVERSTTMEQSKYNLWQRDEPLSKGAHLKE